MKNVLRVCWIFRHIVIDDMDMVTLRLLKRETETLLIALEINPIKIFTSSQKLITQRRIISVDNVVIEMKQSHYKWIQKTGPKEIQD